MKKLSIKTLIILAISLSSCTHYYYIPNVQNVPLFREKNELHATLAVGAGQEISTAEIQTAYSITNNLALMTNFMFASGGERESDNGAKGKYIEGAFGYYKPVGKYGAFEIYGGYGLGKQHHQYQDWSYNKGTADLSLAKYFLQPSFGLTFRPFDIAFSTRFTRLSFYNIRNNIDVNSDEKYYLDVITQNKTSYLFEPAFTIRLGWQGLKVQLQLSNSKNMTISYLRFEKLNVSFGFYYTIAEGYW